MRFIHSSRPSNANAVVYELEFPRFSGGVSSAWNTDRVWRYTADKTQLKPRVTIRADTSEIYGDGSIKTLLIEMTPKEAEEMAASLLDMAKSARETAAKNGVPVE
jgi:hypothetical protein